MFVFALYSISSRHFFYYSADQQDNNMLLSSRLVCLLLLFIICTSNVNAGKHNHHDYNPAHWMKDLKDIIYNQSLLDITLPGTHDSGM